MMNSVFGVFLPAVDQRRLVSLVAAEMELLLSYVVILIPLEETFRLRFLAGPHPL